MLATEKTLTRSDSTGRSLIYAIAAVGALAVGSFEEALEYAKTSQRYMREVNCVLGLNYALLHEGQASLFLGRLNEAIATLDEAHDMAEDNFGADSGLKAVADIIRAAAHYLRNEHETEKLGAALAYAENYDGWFDVYAAGYGTAALLAYAQKGLQAAFSILSSGRQTAENRSLERLSDLLDAYEYLLLVRAGELKRARRLFHQKDLTIRSRPGRQGVTRLAAGPSDRRRQWVDSAGHAQPRSRVQGRRIDRRTGCRLRQPVELARRRNSEGAVA